VVIMAEIGSNRGVDPERSSGSSKANPRAGESPSSSVAKRRTTDSNQLRQRRPSHQASYLAVLWKRFDAAIMDLIPSRNGACGLIFCYGDLNSQRML
jgi:hypothetical protein